MFSLPLALLHNLFIQQSWKSSGELSAFCSATDQLQGHKYQGWKKKKTKMQLWIVAAINTKPEWPSW